MKLTAWLGHWRGVPSPPVDPDKAEELLRSAIERREEAYQRAPGVEALASRLDEHRRRNHFGENIDAIYRRRHA